MSDVPYWSLDAELLTPDEAQRAADAVRRTLPPERHISVVDPSAWLTRHYDRDSVLMLRDALARRKEAGGEVGGLLEDLDEWLATSEE